jgi:hypothetical protein
MKSSRKKVLGLILLNSSVILAWYTVTYVYYEMYLFIPAAMALVTAFIILYQNKRTIQSITYWLFFISQTLLLILIIYYVIIDYALRVN